jgi:hypothetical protein
MATEFIKPDPCWPITEGDFAWAPNCMGASPSRDCWAIINGKLYLFFNNAARKVVFSELQNCIISADNRWRYFNMIWKNNKTLGKNIIF